MLPDEQERYSYNHEWSQEHSSIAKSKTYKRCCRCSDHIHEKTLYMRLRRTPTSTVALMCIGCASHLGGWIQTMVYDKFEKERGGDADHRKATKKKA